MLPRGPKGHRVVSKKSNVDPFRSLLIEFCYLQQPCPQTDVFSIRMSLVDCQPLSATSVNSQREADMKTNAGLSVCCQLKKKIKKGINEPKDLQEHLQTGAINCERLLQMAYDVLQRC